MQYLIIAIQEHKDGISVNIDNLAREDSTQQEKMIADSLEKIYVSITEKTKGELKTMPGTRYDPN